MIACSGRRADANRRRILSIRRNATREVLNPLRMFAKHLRIFGLARPAAAGSFSRQRRIRSMRIPAVAALCLFLSLSARAAEPAPDPEATYTAAITKRADDILVVLKLDDPAKVDRVREILINQYRSLRAIHDARDEKLKSVPKEDKASAEEVRAEAAAKLKPLHDEFLSKLAVELTPEQVTAIKEKMTYNKVQVTFKAYSAYLPQMTDEERGKVLAWLEEAREEAIDGGSSEEKSRIFDKYKGRINNYLASRGYDLKQAEKDFFARQKAAAAEKATTRPGN
jgi:hypothetical protein